MLVFVVQNILQSLIVHSGVMRATQLYRVKVELLSYNVYTTVKAKTNESFLGYKKLQNDSELGSLIWRNRNRCISFDESLELVKELRFSNPPESLIR